MKHGVLLLLAFVATISSFPVFADSGRKYGGYYTEARIATLQRNCETYDWARRERDDVTSRAARWLAMSDEELWKLVPGQDLPRCIDVTFDRLTTGPKRLGCLKCGEKINAYGNYPYEPDFEKKPWKLTCPSCSAVFPTNDFGKFYESAIDEHGLFNPARGDRKLLFNPEHPDPADPLHLFGVDDGFGYIDGNGRSHKFIGYYTWKLWQRICEAHNALANAYLYTGDPTYARKAAILLDRLADVYPSMDWKPYAERGWYHSDGGTTTGKIEGREWECGRIENMADSWEKVLSGTQDNPALYEFLKCQGERYKLPHAKGTRELLVQNIDDDILRCGATAIMSSQVSGNEGMHQRAMATCALALDTDPDTTKWLDWLFEPTGGAIPGLIVGQFDRDGVGPEAAPGYALSWGQNLSGVASRIAGYSHYSKHDMFRDFPQFRAAFTAAWRMCVLGVATPNIGDAGATGVVGRHSVSPAFMATGYRYTHDPEIAVAAWRANGNSAENLGRDIFAADPEALSREIEEVGRKAGPRPAKGLNMTGYDLAILEQGRGAAGIGLSCYYGRNLWHGHLDHLNFDLLAFGAWLAPDQGYPEFATQWPSRMAWTRNTISHNTVVVDQKPQQDDWGGHTRYFKELDGFGAFEMECNQAYPQTREYSRAMMLVGAPGGNAYIVDIFRVAGGNDHVFSLHGPPGAIETSGLNLVAQDKGTYAGKEVPLAATAEGFPLGYSYLYNVRRDQSPPSQFNIDWKAEAGYRGLTEKDNVHLRMHAFTACNDVVLADGDPPQNKPGNPRRLGYALLHRTGPSLDSTFVSVLEPYRDKPVIRRVSRIETDATTSTQVALHVELTDGSEDYVLWSGSPKRMQIEKGISFAGSVGFVRLNGDKVTSAVLIQGTELKRNGSSLVGRKDEPLKPAFEGKIVKMNRELNGGGWLWVDAQLPIDGSLTGQQIIMDTNSSRNACYDIHSVERDGKLSKIYCGSISFMRGYASPMTTIRHQPVAEDYTKGYLYDFDEGARFRIPRHYQGRP